MRESRQWGEGGEGRRKEAIVPGKELYNARCLIFPLHESRGGGLYKKNLRSLGQWAGESMAQTKGPPDRWQRKMRRPRSSVVDPDPDPVESETFSRIRIRKKSFRIRAAPDPK